MLLKGYRKKISRPECNPQSQSIVCIARLDEDITEALPYLNAALAGFQYTREPPSLTIRTGGKRIVVYPREIAINSVEDEEDADRTLEWLREEINSVWEKRTEIQPRFEGMSRPKMMDILRLLPKSNCRECGRPTCMVFAAQAVEGGCGADDCPPLSGENRTKLSAYLGQFRFEG